MEEEDLPSAATFLEADRRNLRVGDPEPEPRTAPADRPRGYIGVRRLQPRTPYLASGHFL
jgi:hypothetical protein